MYTFILFFSPALIGIGIGIAIGGRFNIAIIIMLVGVLLRVACNSQLIREVWVQNEEIKQCLKNQEE